MALLAALVVIGRGWAVGLTPLGAVTQGGLAEFRVTGVPEAANPFDPDLIRVDATFRAPSGELLTVPGFWYRGYTRSLAGGEERLSASGAPEWRVRYRAKEAGHHLASVTVRLNGSADGESAAADFDVQPPASPPARQGFVRLAANNRYFETGDGQALPLVGHCVCWHGQRGTFDYDDWTAAMAAAGENYLRLWMWPFAFGIEAGTNTLQNYRLDRAWQLDYVLQLAEQRGLYAMLCFDYHGMFETKPDYWGANDNWKLNPYNAANGGPCAAPNDFFTSAEARAKYQHRLRYLVARYGHSPNLLAWQFFNEIDNVYAYLQPADVAAWHAAMAGWLKANDPWRHLVTTSLTGGSDRSEIWSLPQLDFAMYHSYSQARPAEALPGIAQRFRTQYGKPVMIGEFGTDWRGWRREADPFLRGWRQGVWSGALSGAVGTSMSWFWESIHSENVYPAFTALRDVLQPAGWGGGDWQPITFATAGDPPVRVGDALAGGQPFSVTLPLEGGWGSKLGGELAVANADAAGRSAAALNAFVHGTAHAELRIPLRLHGWFTNAARLVMHLNSVSGGAVLIVLVDGQEKFRRSLPNKDGQWQVNNEYNEDIAVELPAGRHLVEIRNAGSDWFYLDWVRLENVLPATFANGWQPSPVAVGLRGSDRSLLYVVNPRVSFPANATNATVEPWRDGRVQLQGHVAGRYRAVWFEAQSGRRVGETVGTSDGSLLTLPLPEFSEDVAARVELVKDFSLLAPRWQADNMFAATLQGELGKTYVIESSPDLAGWEPLTVTTGSAEFRVPAGAARQRFYRAKRGD